MRSETQPDGAPDELARVLHDGDVAAWTLAAVAVALSPGGSSREAAIGVLSAVGIDPASLDRAARAQRAAQAAAPLLQAGAVANGDVLWADQSDEALAAQGRASAMAGPAFARMVPLIPGMAELLARPNAAVLDVGTGVGAMAVAYAQALPGVRVVGIDVMPRAIELAAKTVANSTVADRVEVRLQDVQELDDIDCYAMAWIPAPFIPETPLRNGLRRIAVALVPGGWVAVGYGRLTGTPIERAVTRFKTISYGGTALDPEQASELLASVGLVDITMPPTPPGAPDITIGRRAP
jgi:hypothetical protein